MDSVADVSFKTRAVVAEVSGTWDTGTPRRFLRDWLGLGLVIDTGVCFPGFFRFVFPDGNKHVLDVAVGGVDEAIRAGDGPNSGTSRSLRFEEEFFGSVGGGNGAGNQADDESSED